MTRLTRIRQVCVNARDVARPGREVWMAFFDDSEGNVMALTSKVALIN